MSEQDVTITSIDDLRNLDLESQEVVEEVDPSTQPEPQERVPQEPTPVEPQIETVPKVPAEQEATPAYQPNLTYKIKDSELEFDPEFAPLVTSKEVEEKLRDLYTKAGGLDGYKEKYGTLEQNYTELESGYGNLANIFKQMKAMRDAGDYHGFRNALGVDEEFIVKWAEKILDEQELPEDQRRLLEENRRLKSEQQELQTQNQRLQTTSESRSIDSDYQELQGYMAHEKVKPVVEALHGLGINFIKEVEHTGHALWLQSDSDPNKRVEPTVANVVASVVRKYQKLAQPAEPVIETSQQPAQPVTATVQPVVVQRQPTLPTVEGANSAVVEKPITLDELKRLSAAI